MPEDISVAGFGNYEISSLINPALTTVDFPYEKLGKYAIQSLIRKIDGGNEKKIQKTKPKLILRDSLK